MPFPSWLLTPEVLCDLCSVQQGGDLCHVRTTPLHIVLAL
jgi:hypothetical protein